MLNQTNESLAKVGAALARIAPQEWDSITVNLTGAGSMVGSDVDVLLPNGTTEGQHSLDFDGELACIELRNSMAQPDKGTWYNATLTLQPDGQLEAAFDYDNPPFDGNANADLLAEDQEEFPRDSDHLPAWHPSKN